MLYMKISNYEYKLIEILSRNSREAYSSIAKKLRSSRQIVSYTIESLKKKNIINQFYSIINFAKLGYTSYRIMLSFTKITNTKKKEIISSLNKDNVLWIAECGNKWDIIINYLSKDNLDIYNFINSLKNKYSNNIKDYNVLLFVQAQELYNKKDSNDFGSSKEIINIDRIDSGILRILAKDSKSKSVDIAKKLGITPNTVISRIKGLESKKIILDYSVLINLENINEYKYKFLIKFSKLSNDNEKNILSYLKNKIDIVGVIKFVGNWDYEIELKGKSVKDILDVSEEVRDRFKEVIVDFEILPLYHEYRYCFFSG